MMWTGWLWRIRAGARDPALGWPSSARRAPPSRPWRRWPATTTPWTAQSCRMRTSSGASWRSQNARRKNIWYWPIKILIHPYFLRFGGDMTEHCKYTPDIFFLSLFLFFGTFFVAFFLKKFKFTSFFPTKVSAPWELCKHFWPLLSPDPGTDRWLRRHSDHHFVRGIWQLLRPGNTQANCSNNIQGIQLKKVHIPKD